MPKSAKKRRDKAADFSKAKLKLGKGKQLANNAVDTSFKARSIALPTQSIAIENLKEGAPTTKRKLTFEDLIAHLKHYSAGTRKDALLGLRELLETHPSLIDLSLTTLINACVRVIGDEDASVRKALLTFFFWLLPRIPTKNLIPHTPLLILFTTSAQTHIFPEIRIDAIRFLDLFLEFIPETLVPGWTEASGHGNRVLEGYLGILNAGTKFNETEDPMQATSTASIVLSPASKLIILNSLYKFLTHALSSSHRTSTNPALNTSEIPLPTWYLTSSFTCSEAYDGFDNFLRPLLHLPITANSSRCWQAAIEPGSSDEDFVQLFDFATASVLNQWTFQDLSEAPKQRGTIAETEESHFSDVIFVMHLARTLQSILISVFLDCAPVAFSPTSNTSGNELQLVMAVTGIARILYGAIFQNVSPGQHNSARENLKTLLGYMATYFPFRPAAVTNRDIKVEQLLQDLNLIYCELTSLLVLASYTQPSNPNPHISRQTLAAVQPLERLLSLQAERVSEYVIQLLRGEASTTSPLGRPLTPAAYTALLPTIWSLLSQSSLNTRKMSSNVVRATIEHATNTSSKSAVKKFTIEFTARLVLLETERQYKGNFRVDKHPEVKKSFKEWVIHLPKVLWELGSSNLPTTEVILRFLLRLFQRKSCLVHDETTVEIRSRLVPFFDISHPTRGQLPGPYTKLPVSSPLRRLALDVVATVAMISLRETHDDELEAAVDTAVAGTEEAGYWIHLRLTRK